MRFPLQCEEDGSSVRTVCDLCGREIYWNEAFYRMDGETVCDDCVGDCARQILAPFRKEGGA